MSHPNNANPRGVSPVVLVVLVSTENSRASAITFRKSTVVEYYAGDTFPARIPAARSNISSLLTPTAAYMAKMFSSGVSGGTVCEAARM